MRSPTHDRETPCTSHNKQQPSARPLGHCGHASNTSADLIAQHDPPPADPGRLRYPARRLIRQRHERRTQRGQRQRGGVASPRERMARLKALQDSRHRGRPARRLAALRPGRRVPGSRRSRGGAGRRGTSAKLLPDPPTAPLRTCGGGASHLLPGRRDASGLAARLGDRSEYRRAQVTGQSP